jgi:hypothetical protein
VRVFRDHCKGKGQNACQADADDQTLCFHKHPKLVYRS